MSSINIYEQPALVELKIQAEKLPDQISEGRLHELKQLFQSDFSLNPTPIRAVKFSDQFIDPRWALVYDKDGNYIFESAYLKPADLIAQIIAKKQVNVVKLDPEFIYFLAYNHDYENYYHWSIQCLQTLSLYFALKPLYANLKLLLPANLPEFALQYLEVFNLDLNKEATFLQIQEPAFFAEQVIYPSFLGGEFSFNTSQTLLNFSGSYFNRYLKGKTEILKLFKKPKKQILYCSRLDSKNRKITNEQELIDRLKSKFGARIFTNTGQTVKQQAKIFYESDIIISPHGAGMANVIFCRSTTTILELLPDKYLNPCFATLAVHKGCQYHPLAFPTTIAEGHQQQYEWEIDLNALENLLRTII